MKREKCLVRCVSRFDHAIILTVLVACSSLAAQDLAKPGLVEGIWTYRGPRTVVGLGFDITVIVKKETNEWTIAFETTTYPSINQKGALPMTRREGPYNTTVDDQELIFIKDGQEVRYAFLCDSTRMILPAIVRKNSREWTYRAGRESFVVRCENDPFKVPAGKAEIQGVLPGKGFYSYEEAPRSSVWPHAQYLRFLERSDEKGQLFERFRLIFDDYGWPRYQKILQTGERSTSDYELRVFLVPDKKE